MNAKEWVKLSDDIKKATFEYMSGEEVDKADEMTVVVRGHLLVELTLETLLRASLANDFILTNSNISFTMKLKLARSLGLVQPDVFSVIKQLNSIRNDFAHKLHARLDVKKTDRIFELLSQNERGGTALKEIPNDKKGLLGLGIHAIVVRLLEDVFEYIVNRSLSSCAE